MTTNLFSNGAKALIAAAGLGLAGPALAGTSTQRTGINFGTTVRALGSSNDATPDDGSGRSSKSQTTGSLVSPYVGYAWTSVNIGIMYENESETSHTTDVSTDGQQTTDRQSTTATHGTSLFLRYMFASYFYFEGGLGLYNQTQSLQTETRLNGAGDTFSGSSDTYTVTSAGPGAHGGGGIELPIKNGFFFTAAYQVRMIQLRDGVKGDNLGQLGSVDEKQEALFGIAYYDRNN